MKKTIKLIAAGLIAAMTSLPLSGVEDPTEIPVIIVYNPGNEGLDLGRSQSQQVFFAEYNDIWSSVVLSCVDECGDASVTLVSTAGDWYQTVFDTEDGYIIIPVSGDSGHYTLTIVTSDGATYVGEFDL